MCESKGRIQDALHETLGIDVASSRVVAGNTTQKWARRETRSSRAKIRTDGGGSKSSKERLPPARRRFCRAMASPLGCALPVGASRRRGGPRSRKAGGRTSSCDPSCCWSRVTGNLEPRDRSSGAEGPPSYPSTARGRTRAPSTRVLYRPASTPGMARPM